MSKIITVKGIGKPNTVVLWEKNTAHPKGEVFVSTGQTAQVALTPAVQERLRKGTLVKVSGQQQADDSDAEEEEGKEEEGVDKPEIDGAVVSAAVTGSGPVANVVAGPQTAADVLPARGKGTVKK